MAKKLTKLQQEIQRKNKIFAKLSPADKRVAIATDVILQLRAGKFDAQQGVYVSLDRELTKRELKKDASEVFTNKSCTVCGIGGLFVSAVCNADNLPVSQIELYNETEASVEGESAYDYLVQFFDEEQLKAIETAFEQRDDFGADDYEAMWFADDVEDDNDRLRLIMENIIVNNGTFIPSQKPVQQWVTPNFQGV